MINMQKIKKVLPIILLGLFASLPVLAQQPNPAPDLFISFRSNEAGSVIAAIIKAFLGITGILAILYLIWGGFQYLTSGMNSDLAEHGKKTIRYAIVGLIIVILSYIIVTVVVNTLS